MATRLRPRPRPSPLVVGLWVMTGCFTEAPTASSPDRARALLSLLEDEDYLGWPRPPKYQERRVAVGPHGAWVDVYIDPILEEARMGDPIEAWPEGATAICEGFDAEDAEDLSLISILRKQDGAWVFAQLTPTETVAYGRPDVCISCHQFGDDYVRTLKLPKPEE